MIARSIWCAAVVFPAAVSWAADGNTMSADAKARTRIEKQMADWLAHPTEFGVSPRSVHLKHTYKADLITYGKVDIHLVEYTMPDGTIGRGFVNGSLTWSFLGPAVNSIKDDDLLVAYCGWAWLFPPLQKGNVKTEFVSSGEEKRYLAQKRSEGLTDIEVIERYKVGTSELTGFRARRNGAPVQGAGDTSAEVIYPASDARFNLPSIYFLLGEQAINSVH
jgi:hypothetical protein